MKRLAVLAAAMLLVLIATPVQGAIRDCAKVFVSNYSPGQEATYPIWIFNTGSEDATYHLSYSKPHYLEPGYLSAPDYVSEWVQFLENDITLKPDTSKRVNVVLVMPEDAQNFASKWEFWIKVKNVNQSGMIQVEEMSRWLITMAPESQTPKIIAAVASIMLIALGLLVFFKFRTKKEEVK